MAGSWRSAGARSTAWMASAFASGSRRWARVRAAVIFDFDSRAARAGSGARSSSSSASGAIRSGKASSAAGKNSRSATAQPLEVPGAVPDERLMRPGHQLQPLDLGAVAGHGPVMGTVQPHDLGQHVRVAAVGLGAGGAVSFPVAGHLHRIEREHLVAGRDQRRHPGAAIGLDPDHHALRDEAGLGIEVVLGEVLGDEFVQPSQPGDPLRQPSPRQPPPFRRPEFRCRGGPRPSHHLRTASAAPQLEPVGRQRRKGQPAP